jgi:hypothetical protein
MAQDKTESELDSIFEQVLASSGKGRRCDPRLMPPYSGLRSVLVQFRERMDKWVKGVRAVHAPRMYPVHIGYVENFDMNAFAFVREGYGFVGLYVGTLITILSFFNNLLAHPDFFPSIGDPAAEESWSGLDSLRIDRVPKDAVRAAFAGLLSVLALDYFFTHEIGHLMHGHVDLANMRLGVPVFAEFDATRGRTLGNLTSQTLEMDADTFAIGQGLATAFGRASNPAGVSPERWRQWYQTPRAALATWSTAVYGLFRVLADGEVPSDDLLSSTHPAPHVRLFIAYTTATEYLKKHGPFELAPQLDGIFAEAVPSIEKGHAFLTSTQAEAHGARAAFEQPSRAHLVELLKHWKTLRPELLPLVRGGNLAE